MSMIWTPWCDFRGLYLKSYAANIRRYRLIVRDKGSWRITGFGDHCSSHATTVAACAEYDQYSRLNGDIVCDTFDEVEKWMLLI